MTIGRGWLEESEAVNQAANEHAKIAETLLKSKLDEAFSAIAKQSAIRNSRIANSEQKGK